MSDLYLGKILSSSTRRLKLEESWHRVLQDRQDVLFQLSQELLEARGDRPSYANPDMNAFEILCLELEHVFTGVEVEQATAMLTERGFPVGAVPTPTAFPFLPRYPYAYWLSEWMARKYRETVGLEPLTLVTVELAQIHPDAWFPSDEERAARFCTRVLTEAFPPYYDRSPIYRHFESYGRDAWAQTDFSGGEADVFGIVLEVRNTRTIDMQVESENFWESHSNQWWASARRWCGDVPSDNVPFQVRTYEILTHPAWLGELKDRFESRAYG